MPGVPVSLLRDWVEQFVRDERELHSEPFFDIDRLDQQASGSIGSSLSPVAEREKASVEDFKRWKSAGAKKKDKGPEMANGGVAYQRGEFKTTGERPGEGEGPERKQWPALLPNARQNEGARAVHVVSMMHLGSERLYIPWP